MNTSIKAILIFAMVGLLIKCVSVEVKHGDQSYSEENNPHFDEAVKYMDWMMEEYATYKARPGHKAFAIGIDEGYVLGSGFGYDKISQQAAIDEAIRLCQFFSKDQGQCVLVDKADTKDWQGLSQQTIADAPKALISYRDINNYQTYLKATPPKAFAVADGSGQGFWIDQQPDVSAAKSQALEACRYVRHEADLGCSILHSE